MLQFESYEFTGRVKRERNGEKRLPMSRVVLYRLAVALLLCISCASASFTQRAEPSVVGSYAGTLGPLHLRLHVRRSPSGGLTGTMDSIDQEAFGIPCTQFILSGRQFSFAVPVVHGTYKGKVSANGNTITGTWNQGRPRRVGYSPRPQVCDRNSGKLTQ
jgi:hypothetical protein